MRISETGRTHQVLILLQICHHEAVIALRQGLTDLVHTRSRIESMNFGVQGHVIPTCDIPLLYCILMRKINKSDNALNLYTSRQTKLEEFLTFFWEVTSCSSDIRLLTIWRNSQPPSSGLKCKLRQQTAIILLVLLPEDGDSTFLWIARKLLQCYNPEVTCVITSDPTLYVASPIPPVLCSSLNVRNQVSRPYKTISKIYYLYCLHHVVYYI
jgi:hypothetical protein